MLDAILPPDLPRCERRLATILLTLGVLVLTLFPQAAGAGTETLRDRVVTGGALVLAGLALRLVRRSAPVVLVLHGAVQVFAGGAWAAVVSAALLVYAGGSWLRGQSGAAAPAHAGEEHEAHAADVVRDNVEAVAMALVIALTVREFMYEAFLIPTGSMYPTILGKDLQVGRTQGDRLLASKLPLLFADPPRWSIVVFRYPLFRKINYIKRLVGLPGEKLELRAGDVYVNGTIVAKPEEVQDTLWFAEYPAENEVRGLDAVLRNDDGRVAWTIDTTSAAADVPANTESTVWYDETLASDETDLRIAADVVPSRLGEHAAVLLAVDGGQRRVALELGTEACWLEAPGIGRVRVPDAELPRDGARVALGVADRVARVWIDGRLVARIQHDDVTNEGRRQPRVSLGLRDAAATLSDVRVDRDLQYAHSGAQSWQIPDDGFVMLGDNTGSSHDSRLWKVNVVTLTDGRKLEGQQSLNLEDGSTAYFRQSEASVDFLDADGIPRHIPSAQVANVARDVPQPFVRRSDLIGRAFLIFFPFPPFGDLRPRFLP